MHKANPFKHPKNPVDQAFNVNSDESLTTSEYDKSVACAKSLFKQKSKSVKDVFQVSFNETVGSKSQDTEVEKSEISALTPKINPFKNKRKTESPREVFLNKTTQSEYTESSTLISGDSSLVKKSGVFKKKKLSEVSVQFNESNKFDKSLNWSKTLDGEDVESIICMPKSNPFKKSLKKKENDIAVSFVEDDDDIEKSITDVRRKSEKLITNLSIDKSLPCQSDTALNESTFNTINQSSFNDENLNHWMSDHSDEEISNADAENNVEVPPPNVPPVITSDDDPTSTSVPATSDEEKASNAPVLNSDEEKIENVPAAISEEKRQSISIPLPTDKDGISINKDSPDSSTETLEPQISISDIKGSSSKEMAFKSVPSKISSVPETAQKDKELTWEEKLQKIISKSRVTHFESTKTSKPVQSSKPRKPMKPGKPMVEIKGYKPPKLIKPARFATKNLYNYIIKRLEPKFGINKFIEAEKLVLSICDTVKLVTRRKVHQKKLIHDLKKEMAKAGVIETTFDFYEFVIKFLPYNFRIKVVPCVQPVTNAVYPPMDVENPFDKIL